MTNVPIPPELEQDPFGLRVPEDCYVYLRQADGQRILVALNFSDQEQQVTLPPLGKGKIAMSTHLDREEGVNLDELVLHGNEGVIVELPEP